MDCYIIPVGGTGSRVMRAITHLMASGVLNKTRELDKVHFMCVDSDAQNGDKTRMEATVRNYMSIQNTQIIKKKIEPPFPGENSFTWSPLDVNGSNMGAIENYANMDRSVQELYDFLYTQQEKNIELRGGFYSHTSIGSYYMTNGIVGQDGRFLDGWDDYFTSIRPGDLIIIICSMFGGTGASGVPTLARKIRETRKTQDCKIAGIFIEPYFRSDEEDIIDSDTFNVKTKIALEYYSNQGFDKTVFDKMYFIGDTDLMRVEHNIDGTDQINKANMVEFYAATAVVDYIHDNETTGVQVAFRGNDKDDKAFSPALINKTSGVPVYSVVMNFLQFSVLYTKFLYHCIKQLDGKDEREQKKIVQKCQFIGYYNFVSDDGRIYDDVQNLYDYCCKYITWIRELITKESPDGKFPADYSWLSHRDAEDNPHVHWIARKQYTLYDGKFVHGVDYWDRCKELDAFISDEYPGYTKFIHGKTITESGRVFQLLCNPPKEERRDVKSVNRFIADVVKLSNKGEW